MAEEQGHHASRVYTDHNGDLHLNGAKFFNDAEVDIAPIIEGFGVQSAAMTAQLTTITPADAEGTPDYAIQAITNSTPYGFVNAQECITLLYVVKNLQVRLAEVEAALEAANLVAAN